MNEFHSNPSLSVEGLSVALTIAVSDGQMSSITSVISNLSLLYYWGWAMRNHALMMIFLVPTLLFSVFFATRPISFGSTPSSSETLLGAGAKWAANGGTKAAYVDFYDNLVAHPELGDPSPLLSVKNEVLSVLEGEGFTVDTFADIPANLSQYSLVYLEAYFACEPSLAPAIENYTFNGGGVVVWSGAETYLAHYSKSMNNQVDLSGIASWFGASYFVNTGGAAYVSVTNPLGTSLNMGDPLVAGLGYSCAGITSMSADSQIVAVWDDGSTFAFTHEYGQGRMYWQSYQQGMSPPGGSNEMLSLKLYGGFDYGISEQAKIKVFAELSDAVTMEPISGANVTIQVYAPNDTLWVSAIMVETSNGKGVYEWESADTIANTNLQVGVYLAQVAASTGISSTFEIMAFHIDPPATSTGTGTLQLYLATILSVVLGGILIALVFRKRNLTAMKL
ncbi:MAG TPA: hypothetical protein VEH86_07600 [Candidatus Acidoferrum sp.]|nr:hypothetical protein [Candidatus Acidoferrum sp.]